MSSRRLSLSLILGIVATPIIVTADKADTTQTQTSEVQVSQDRPIENFRFYSPIIEALIPETWELPVPDDLSRESEELYRVRKRRDTETDNTEENMVTAEQILFRPLFRHRQLVEEREQRLKAKQDERRQALYTKYYNQVAQRKQYNPYQNYYPNYYSQINSQPGYYRHVRAVLPDDYYYKIPHYY